MSRLGVKLRQIKEYRDKVLSLAENPEDYLSAAPEHREVHKMYLEADQMAGEIIEEDKKYGEDFYK